MWAHSGRKDDRSDWETASDHLAQMRRLAIEIGRPLGLERAAAIAGELHDLGKFNRCFKSDLPAGR